MARTEGNRAATIFDVARLAGVSHQTVSRVINDSPDVRDQTRERVRKAIKQLRYEPSAAARALVTRRTRTIGLIAPGSADYGPASIQRFFNEAAHAARYSVFTVSVPGDSAGEARSAIESLLRQNVEAVVLVQLDVPTLESLRGLDVGVPLISVSAPGRHGDVVAIDQYGGARAAVQHLIDSGYLDVIHVAGPPDHPDARERQRGWADELADAGVPRGALYHADWSAAEGHRIGLELTVIAGKTAVFAANDQLALGVMSALARRGYRVPDDVGVVGFDNIPESVFFTPPLSTVTQDFAALGQLALRRVLDRLDGDETSPSPPPIPVALVVRASSQRRRGPAGDTPADADVTEQARAHETRTG
ncbi:LacI family DNA-binding transcriptional regulator [Humibacter sp.]|uniref:LacI family DNA-binding transcriptional regulator n=1 Tax=Humibacter sp. TaxID=1940291 RepID=UPI003F7E95E4